ncbi:hypothetical protein BV20DRAFT_1117005, partial [Pilatotrama ljubarskyi]
MPDPPEPRNASAALASLKATVLKVEEHEEKLHEIENGAKGLRGELTTVLKALHLEIGTAKAEILTLRERVAILETALGLEVDGEGGGEDAGGDVTAEGVEGESAAEREKIERSIGFVNSKPIKTAVNLVFKHLMGVSTLVGERLPPHPNFPTGEAPYVVPID